MDSALNLALIDSDEGDELATSRQDGIHAGIRSNDSRRAPTVER